jgi:hypothetical protein
MVAVHGRPSWRHIPISLSAVIRSGVVEASALAGELLGRGFMHVREPIEDKALAWATARAVFAAAARSDALGADMPGLEVVGEFTVPPPGALRRDFQALHIDFGVPVEADAPADLARFTALYVDSRWPPTSAVTRVVPLQALLRQRSWSDPDTLLASLRRYGKECGAAARYVEGILGRLVEAADECAALPSPADPNFLCGLEFASPGAERAHFARHSLELEAVEQRVRLSPGELLVFDNLRTAHGRAGIRRPEELHQLCVGYRGLDTDRQRTLSRRVLAAFAPAHE